MNPQTVTVDQAARLSEALQDPVLLPADAGYDRARQVWNADVKRHPAAIVACQDSRGVARALATALDLGFEVTVRGGGHNLAGTAVIDGAVMLDLRAINEVSFDDARQTVTVGAGCVWGDVDRPGNDRGVAVPAGVVSHTGVAGLTLGGGTGYLSRLHGATADHLVALEVVLADGRILQIDQEHEPDLFWAMRGAGHNYAIATRFTFRHVPVAAQPTVHQALFGANDRQAMLDAVAAVAPSAPDAVTVYARLLTAPPFWSQVPTRHRGEPIISVATVAYGDSPAIDAARDRLWGVAAPIWSTSYSLPHVELQHRCDDEFRYGLCHYWKHSYLRGLDSEVIRTAITWADRYPGAHLQARATIAPQMQCPFEVLSRGGALARIDPSSTAVSSRDAPWSANIGADWASPEEKDELVTWARAFAAELEPYAAGSYINFTSVQGDESLARAVYGEDYERLAAIKAAVDPHNVFRRGLADLTPQLGA